MLLISILLPVYNAAPFLKECLQSILKQTEPHWELLAVDDFSTDDSALILKQFAAKNPRIRFLSNTEKGIIPALRLAFQNSKGSLITRMDADDLMPVDKLAILKKGWETHGKGHVITGLVDYFSQTTLGAGYQNYQNWLNGLTMQQRHYKEIYKECVLPSPAWLVHREDLIMAGGFMPDRYPEDYDLCFRFYKQQLKIAGITQIVHQWRDHAHRTSRTSQVYANANYLDLKIYWFLKLDYDPKKTLVIWGAGKKGKWIAKYLINQNIPFKWITDNPRKKGITIYEHPLVGSDFLIDKKNTQTIIAIATPADRIDIQDFLDQNETDYFWFC